MVNLWGPGAFDSLNPSASRPTVTPDNAPGDVDDWFKDCSSPLFADGTEWRSGLLNLLVANLRGVVRGSATPDSNLDDFLIAKAIQSGGMNYAIATGTANNWVVALNLALTSYRAGRVLWLRAPATNTSTTVVAVVDALAARPIRKADGSVPAIGDLVSGRWYPTIDDGTNICVLSTLPSDTTAVVAANKSPFNVTRAVYTARVSLSGTGMVNYQTGTYTKKSASSQLVVECSTNLFAASTAAGFGRVSGLPSNLEFVTRNADGGISSPACTGSKIYAGLAAGVVNWTWSFGRGDALAWNSIINPRTADASYLPAETTSFIQFSELEP